MRSDDVPTRQALVPCFIPAFNNPTYVRRTIAQLSGIERLKLVILDNSSSYGPMQDLCS